MAIAAEPVLFGQLRDLLASLDAERDAVLARGSTPPPRGQAPGPHGPEPPAGLRPRSSVTGPWPY
jgi:hypothetical protein